MKMITNKDLKSWENNRKTEMGVYYGQATLNPHSKLKRISKVCLLTPCTDFIMYVWFCLSFFNIHIRTGHKLKHTRISLSRSDMQITKQNIKQFIFENWKIFLLSTCIVYIIKNLI